jgi:ethanolamine transporter EutH
MKDVQNFKIYPNPANDYITIPELNNGLQPIVHKVQIFDVLGIDVSSAGASVIEVDGGGYRIDISKLPAGVYFVIVGGMVEKFVKM